MASPTKIQTYRGKLFDTLNPQVDQLDIYDIAHALSYQCRFNGHSKYFYCPTEDQKILTGDLLWTPAGELEEGTLLVGFDEKPIQLGSGGHKRRRFRPAVITACRRVKRNVIRLEMEDGSTVLASEEHPWLIASKKSRNQKWMETRQIADDISGGRIRYMHRFLDVWKAETDWQAGWLSGMLDGEGFFSSKNRKGILCGIAQREGLVLEALKQRLRLLGVPFSVLVTGNQNAGIRTCQIRGGYAQILKVLGRFRPMRLLVKFKECLLNGDFVKQVSGISAPLRIVESYNEGEQWVVGIETSTHTYFCEGYGAHNSVAQHAVICSYAIAPVHALWGLMHDASEAYIPDMPGPTKHQIPKFKEVEERIHKVIAEWLELPYPMPPEVKEGDNIALATEVRDLMQPSSEAWGYLKEFHPLRERIYPLASRIAELQFLRRFDELTGQKTAWD
jgi:5'-deoxynucleotidase YfbR-like HD superfamily hydrolase